MTLLVAPIMTASDHGDRGRAHAEPISERPPHLPAGANLSDLISRELRSRAPTDILRCVYGFKMGNVHAEPLSTEMVELLPILDRTIHAHPRDAMRWMFPKESVAGAVVSASDPDETSVFPLFNQRIEDAGLQATVVAVDESPWSSFDDSRSLIASAFTQIRICGL